MFSIFYFLFYLFIYLHHASSEPGQRNTPLRVGSPRTGQTMTTPCGTARGGLLPAPCGPPVPLGVPQGHGSRTPARPHRDCTREACRRQGSHVQPPGSGLGGAPASEPRPPETGRADVGCFQRARSVACSLAVWVPQPPNSAPLGRRLQCASVTHKRPTALPPRRALMPGGHELLSRRASQASAGDTGVTKAGAPARHAGRAAGGGAFPPECGSFSG